MQQLEELLKQWTEPYLGIDLIHAKAVKIKSPKEIFISLPFVGEHYQHELKMSLSAWLKEQGVDTNLEVEWHVHSHRVQKELQRHPEIKNIIAVGSAKGGVGKSTTAVNLALALQAEGAKVGILDADIYGPSLPRMLNCFTSPETKDKKHILPVEKYGLQTMSIGYLVEEAAAMIWRGPMVSTALQQLMRDTVWQGLDYLILDLPPGTGDIQLTMAQKLPIAGVVIVTTPQEVAVQDAQKGITMFNKVDIPILGIVENMSLHVCSQCGHHESIFSQGGGERLALESGVAFLGQLPLDKGICDSMDKGEPLVVAQPQSMIAKTYREMARKVSANLAKQPKIYDQFSAIQVEMV